MQHVATIPLFRDCIEQYLGTNPLDNCAGIPGTGGDSWPLDLNASKSVNVTDILMYKGKTPHAVDASHPQRQDLNADSLLNVLDILYYKGKSPSACS